MRKTRKKILGFMGLGLVVATTAIAATLPSPIAAAVTSSVTDTIKVTVLSPNPDLVLTAEEGSEITSPEYNFNVFYSSLIHIKATLVNYDADGNVKFEAILWDTDLDGAAGSKDFSLNLDEYGGYGDFVITFKGNGAEGITAEQILSTSFIMDSVEVDVNPDTSSGTTEVTPPDETVTTIETKIYSPEGNLVRITKADVNTGTLYVYDASGNLLFTIENGYKDGKLTIPMEGLPYSDNYYTGEIVFRNAENKLVGGVIRLKIKYQGTSPVVPDTGSFFQGLNISREDYLITGLIAFMAIGVVAFSIVARNRGNSKHNKVSGKNRR